MSEFIKLDIGEKGKELLTNTFSFKSKKLPTMEEVLSLIGSSDPFAHGSFELAKMDLSFMLREHYTKNSFPILNDDFITAIKKMVAKKKITTISELSCGIGWLSYWLKKYGVDIVKSVDNKSWEHFGADQYLDLVVSYDSIEYVKENPEIELFILSWPYMDSVAFEIWKNMIPGQYLLYIGESESGCTASDDFFGNVFGMEVEDDCGLHESFISFWGIRDRPVLYKKQKYGI